MPVADRSVDAPVVVVAARADAARADAARAVVVCVSGTSAVARVVAVVDAE